MVTHNPNLAVVCDAEQIIHARFDRASDSTIRYESGAIENTGLNEAVVTILRDEARIREPLREVPLTWRLLNHST